MVDLRYDFINFSMENLLSAAATDIIRIKKGEMQLLGFALPPGVSLYTSISAIHFLAPLSYHIQSHHPVQQVAELHKEVFQNSSYRYMLDLMGCTCFSTLLLHPLKGISEINQKNKCADGMWHQSASSSATGLPQHPEDLLKSSSSVVEVLAASLSSFLFFESVEFNPKFFTGLLAFPTASATILSLLRFKKYEAPLATPLNAMKIIAQT